ncbi:Concanavalin A-like lectin/glucanase, subgroup [Phaffia rhodozyma]|uniref:Concanavalin A-like lectin/glucanase, subgroup n=1 Tax=Phaffia rhodozyma TaxID=264483 RepID=A0A0F7SUD0_PHARH|nr:Concanavalin A-like lectin/glucanase, subgroup [Phaffia rhodozyma]
MRSRPYLSSSPQAYQGLLPEDGSRESSSTSFSEFQYNILDQRNSSSLEAGSALRMEKISYGPEDWEPEADDYLHNPSPDDDDSLCMGLFSVRAFMNLGCLFVLGGALLVLFGGYPIITYVRSLEPSTGGAFNLGGVNGSGQVPATISGLGLIDDDTPESAYTMTSNTGVEWELVFSDEFNVDGRSFYSGDDPYWEANDLHAWATDDLEWYSPEAVTTANGSLVLTLSNITQHDLYYQGAEISSWNKFCFTGGRLEASVKLPGRPDVYGLWPAVWTLGNLGRVGYGGTLDGLWPYSYDSCDVGTVANQSKNGVPEGASNLNGAPRSLTCLANGCRGAHARMIQLTRDRSTQTGHG